MDVLFPASPRVRFRRNPLVEVICQLRFPPILRIENRVPDAFQDAIRGRFPGYTKRATGLPAGMPPELARALFAKGVLDGAEARTLHRFDGESGRVTLCRDFVSLSTESYESWDAFSEDLLFVSKATTATYHPAAYTRVGLRYRNLIQRSSIGLTDVPWSELLQPHALGELVAPQLATAATETLRQLSLEFGDTDRATIRHGLVHHEVDGEQCYIVDADFYTEESIDWKHARPRLAGYRNEAGHLFRWLVTDTLIGALEPHGDPQ